MAQYRNPHDHPREVPWLGRVVDVDEIVHVPDDLADSFLEAGWDEIEPPVRPDPDPEADPGPASPADTTTIIE